MSRKLIPTSTGWWSSCKRNVSRLALLTLTVTLLIQGSQVSLASQVSHPELTTSHQALHSASSNNALTYLKSLKTKVWASHDGYSRGQFSDGWGKISMSGHSCDLRNYILTRDLKNITRSSSNWCNVTSGVLNDPYTGKSINFVRGVKTSNAVQIDHVVALSNAWSTGAQALSAASRYSLANDPMNLLAVDGPTNASKSDKDAASFLPRLAYQCKYVARQLAVKKKYKLWVTSAEKAKMTSVLKTCPSQLLPTK